MANSIQSEIDHLNYCIAMLMEKRDELCKKAGVVVDTKYSDVSSTVSIDNLMPSDALKFADIHNLSIRSLMKDMYNIKAWDSNMTNSFGVLMWMLQICTGATTKELYSVILKIPEAYYRQYVNSLSTPNKDTLDYLGNVLGMNPDTLLEFMTRRYPYDMILKHLSKVLYTVLEQNKWIEEKIPKSLYEEVMEGFR